MHCRERRGAALIKWYDGHMRSNAHAPQIDAMVRKTVSSCRQSAPPADFLDLALLADPREAIDVGDYSDPLRMRLRSCFWEHVDEAG